jgi:hypothetical protein
MPEELGGGAEIPNIELPGALRIRQRLGQVSTERAFSQHLIPQLAKLGQLSMTPTELVGTLESKISQYAEDHVLGMVSPVLESKMPKIIDSLIDDQEQKKSVFGAWEARVVELKGNSLKTSQHIQSRYLDPRRKTSRKSKKARKARNGYQVL